MKKYIAFVLLCAFYACADSSVVSYQETNKGRFLVGATVHLGNGEYLENAALVIKNGEIIELVEGFSGKIDYKNYVIEELNSDHHIYPFRKADATNSGIVLALADADPMNISIINKEAEKSIEIGAYAELLVCYGSIQDAQKFRVDFVIIGTEKVSILKQSDYGDRGAID